MFARVTATCWSAARGGDAQGRGVSLLGVIAPCDRSRGDGGGRVQGGGRRSGEVLQAGRARVGEARVEGESGGACGRGGLLLVVGGELWVQLLGRAARFGDL